MTILVTGASGNVGRGVLDLLLEAGAPVRASSRNPQSAGLPAAVDVRAADLADPSTLPDALAGVEKVFLFPVASHVDGFVQAAEAAGVKHVVLLSSQAAAFEDDNPITMMHLSVERALEQSSLAWTFIRPGSFATNTLQWAKPIQDTGVVRIPYAEAQLSPIHERDIAAVSVHALVNDGHEGAAYELTGPESITQRREAELIGAAIGRSIEVVDLGQDEARAELTERFGPYGSPAIIDTMLTLFAGQVGKPAELTDNIVKITGRPARTFAEWAVDHKADFTG